ncbi:MAG: hypothetical protein NUV76_12095 [Candidatus Kuenenia sp.]|nr:hypothetical protein [Candidatus Kuenenia sp.]
MITKINDDIVKIEAYGFSPGMYNVKEFSDTDLLRERGILTSLLFTGEYDARKHTEIGDIIDQINRILDARCQECWEEQKKKL